MKSPFVQSSSTKVAVCRRCYRNCRLTFAARFDFMILLAQNKYTPHTNGSNWAAPANEYKTKHTKHVCTQRCNYKLQYRHCDARRRPNTHTQRMNATAKRQNRRGTGRIEVSCEKEERKLDKIITSLVDIVVVATIVCVCVCVFAGVRLIASE